MFGYYLMAFRTSLGDFELDNFEDGSSLGIIYLRWLIWVIGVFVLNLIFMNFVIAVISESYEKIMQKSIAEGYRGKAMMIVEREFHLTESELKNE